MEIWLMLLIFGIGLIVIDIIIDLDIIIYLGAALVVTSLVGYFISNIYVLSFVFILLLLIAFYMMHKKFKSKEEDIKTSFVTVIGKEGIVTKEVDFNSIEPGTIKVIGEDWTATSIVDTKILVGEKIKVVKIEGAIACIERV